MKEFLNCEMHSEAEKLNQKRLRSKKLIEKDTKRGFHTMTIRDMFVLFGAFMYRSYSLLYISVDSYSYS